MRNCRGFTLIETVVVLIVAAVIAAGLFYVLSSSRRSSRLAELDSQAQQNARVAVDYVTRDLRAAGYGTDYGRGQRGIVYAGPYDIIFNANIEPALDDASTPGYPTAINVSSSPAAVPSGGTPRYAPATTFETGAETIRFTFDSNNDGVVNLSDASDETVEETANPYDYMLERQVYGYNGSDNGGSNEQIALLRGPDAYPTGSYPLPLFAYWYDHDDNSSTPDLLWNDRNGDGVVDSQDVPYQPVPSDDLGRITRVTINAIGTARAADVRHSGDQGFREAVLTSEVSVSRNMPVRAAYIRGVVFDDLNGDGAQGAGELGLSGVQVTLNTGARQTTNASGYFLFRVDPGTYTVREFDPPGYTSTTPNTLTRDAVSGTVVLANFGDRAITGYGAILGRVLLYEQVGEGDPTPTGDGVQDVRIFLDSGERDTTDVRGAYMFTVPVNTYSITMIVPPGYLAVGPITVDRTLQADGDTVMVNFGLISMGATGTIAGKVYIDDNSNGVLDTGESGLGSVIIRLSNGDSTLTDGQGSYSFTLLPGTYDVTERDPGGYVSTTINNVTGVVLEADSTVYVNFGDVLAENLSFTVITLGETQRALCITSGDLKEDSKNDPEIILGTKYVSGVSNLNVWENKRKSGSTANSDIFDQTPWYSRTPNEDIFSVAHGDVNGDGVNDVLTGLTSATGRVLVWQTQTSGSNKGVLPTTPTSFFISSGPADVFATVLYDVDSDHDLDALIGTEYVWPLGKFEVWFNNGSGTFTHGLDDIYDFAGLFLLTSVRSLAVGNVVQSPAADVVVGTISGVGTGAIQIYRDNGSPSGKFLHYRTLRSHGEVNAVAVADMLEDGNGDLDILAGTKISEGVGQVELWLNNGDGTFGVYDNGTGRYEPSDVIDLDREVLCLGVARFDKDIYPDLAVGVKTAGTYSGDLKIFQCYGYLPSAGNEFSTGDIGEAITLTIDDFNIDQKPDVAVGTRTSLSQGTVVVLYNTREG